MNSRRIETTADYHRAKANARIVCLTSKRIRIVDGMVLMQWFITPVTVKEAQRRMRCRQCGNKGVRIDPVPA